MRILIISWYFPPWNESASNRPHSWARYFARHGHPTTVLTCRKDPRLHPDLSTPLEPEPNLTVIETPLRLLDTPVAKGASWAAGSVPEVMRQARRHDVIISTFMPWYVHVLGMIAKRANPRALWCADYRDLWHEFDFFMQGRTMKRALAARFEKFVVGPADLTTTVSPPLAESLSRTHPHIPSHTIYNGFPEAECRTARTLEELRARAAAGRPFEIMYAGTVYEGGYHDPEPLFRVLARGHWPRPVRLCFYGQAARSNLIRSLRERYHLEAVVELPEKPLSRADCVQRQREADLLLHLGWTNRSMDGVLTGKVFEYLAAGAPVLSVGADPDTAIGLLLEQTRAGLCVARDDATIAGALEQLMTGNDCPAWFAPRRDEILFYSRERQAGRLLDLLAAKAEGRWVSTSVAGAAVKGSHRPV